MGTRVLVTESSLRTALAGRAEVEDAELADQVKVIDGELRQHGIAMTRAAARAEQRLPAITAALDAVRAELGEPAATGGPADQP